MSATAPRIGFDRYLALEWVTAAMRVRAGMCVREEVDAMLDSAGLGTSARKKTLTLLNRLWLQPRPELAKFADRGACVWRDRPGIPAAALSWGMAIAAYPFFAKVAELVGRLTSIQGDCTASEVHRRMEEMFGQREGTRRMTNMALQTQAAWGAIERPDRGRRIQRKGAIRLGDEQVVSWLIEAALRFAGRPVPVSSIGSMAVLYPFVLDGPLAYVASRSGELKVHSDGSGQQLVGVRDGA